MQIAESGRRTRLPVLLAVPRAACRHGGVALADSRVGWYRRAGHRSGRSSALGAHLDWAVVGPERGVRCPIGAVSLPPGAEVQRFVDAHPGYTTFCLKAGVHAITNPITPKTGDTFVGEYGAILDGTGWTTTDSTQGAFRAHNEDIDNVTIRNLVIRNMPQKGIHAFRDFSDNWTIEYNEIAFNHSGILFPNYSIIRNNYIHHNVGTPTVLRSSRARWRLRRVLRQLHDPRHQRNRL